jgi:glycosyltransferase involved in cell wall biosynthesis
LLDKRYPLERPWTPKIVELFFRFIPNKGHELTVIMPTKFSETRFRKKKRLFYLVHSKLFLSPLSILKKLRFIIKSNKKSRFDIIHVRNGIIDGFIGIYLRRKCAVPFVYELTFPMALKLQRYKLYDERLKSIYFIYGKIWEYLSVKIMKEADLVIPQSKWMKLYLLRKGIYKKKMLPHSMGVNIDFFSPKIPSNRIRDRLNLGESKILIYVGNMNKMRKLHFLLNCFLHIKNVFKNVKLVLIGEGDDRANLEDSVRKQKLQNDVIFTGQIPYTEVPKFIATADIGLSPIPPDPVFLISSPTKVFEYLAMAKPVVASDIPEQKEIILKSRAGLCVPFREKDFSEAVCHLLKNRDLAREMGLRGRRYVSKYYSFSYLGKKLLSWYEHLGQLRN